MGPSELAAPALVWTVVGAGKSEGLRARQAAHPHESDSRVPG